MQSNQSHLYFQIQGDVVQSCRRMPFVSGADNEINSIIHSPGNYYAGSIQFSDIDVV